jgi:hypothetical protein
MSANEIDRHGRVEWVGHLRDFITKPIVALAIAVLVGLSTLLTIGTLAENWRGKRAWAKCKRELEAKGAVLDWKVFVPPPVPDEQNVFVAPNMADYFIRGRTNSLYQRLGMQNLHKDLRPSLTNALVCITILPPEAADPTDANLILKYDPPALTIAPAQPNPLTLTNPVVIPLIVMDDVPLPDAIKNLARQANIRYVLHPKTFLDEEGHETSEAYVSLRWTNVPAEGALYALLHNYYQNMARLALVDEKQLAIYDAEKELFLPSKQDEPGIDLQLAVFSPNRPILIPTWPRLLLRIILARGKLVRGIKRW